MKTEIPFGVIPHIRLIPRLKPATKAQERQYADLEAVASDIIGLIPGRVLFPGKPEKKGAPHGK